MYILFRFKNVFFMNFSLLIFFNFLYKPADIQVDSNPHEEWGIELVMGTEMEMGETGCPRSHEYPLSSLLRTCFF